MQLQSTYILLCATPFRVYSFYQISFVLIYSSLNCSSLKNSVWVICFPPPLTSNQSTLWLKTNFNYLLLSQGYPVDVGVDVVASGCQLQIAREHSGLPHRLLGAVTILNSRLQGASACAIRVTQVHVEATRLNVRQVHPRLSLFRGCD